jgi:hypothetical protein
MPAEFETFLVHILKFSGATPHLAGWKSATFDHAALVERAELAATGLHKKNFDENFSGVLPSARMTIRRSFRTGSCDTRNSDTIRSLWSEAELVCLDFIMAEKGYSKNSDGSSNPFCAQSDFDLPIQSTLFLYIAF